MAGTVITVKGRSLIAKMIALESTIEFTRTAVGTGSLPPGYDPQYATGLNQYQMDGKIKAAKADGEVADITFQISSKDVEQGFVITEAGLFAQDPDEGEILYAYLDMSTDPQYIYQRGGSVNKVAEITLGVIIGAIEKVTARIAPDSLITRKEFEEGMETKSGIVVMNENIPVSEHTHNTWYLNVTDTQSYRAVKTNRALGFRIIGEEDTICQT